MLKGKNAQQRVCPDGQEINPVTGRCVKKCEKGKVRDQKTGKCVKDVDAKEERVCPEGKEINPVIGRCVKKCEKGKVRDQKTGKCVKDVNAKEERANNLFNEYKIKYETASNIEEKKTHIKNLYDELIALLEISPHNSMKLVKINQIKNSELYERALKYEQNKSNYKKFNYFDLNTMDGM